MGRVFNFYYDVISVHSWIIFERLCLAKACTSDIINFKPVHAASVLTAAGNKIPYYSPPLKKFFFHDIRFLGRLHGIPIKTSKELIDDLLMSTTSSVTPQYLLTLIAERYPDKLIDASQLMWTMLWVENRTIHNDNDIAEIVDMLGLPSTTADESLDEKWAELLHKRQTEAIDSGCFGVPWLVIQEEDGKTHKYFGCDRWSLIQRNFSTGYQKFAQTFNIFNRPLA